ncbi:hypothetical protein C3489_01760 [Streptomyces sp. Ru71]|uniref:hypothetical protein n=1 Tax=Streptomyces sp. Ru71 TaxID=2080746 RepID=UPI000CDCE08E|nr:hypothetical protein [Streptomyces sp. Ru71]POX57003.1 hypothetical protein C3489_01760 [Streptomyces sp. Ru71]
MGVCALLAGIAYGATRVATLDQIALVITVGVVVVSLATYVASIRRRRHDRRAARGRVRSRAMS